MDTNNKPALGTTQLNVRSSTQSAKAPVQQRRRGGLGGSKLSKQSNAKGSEQSNQDNSEAREEDKYELDSEEERRLENFFPEIASFSQKVELFAFENHIRRLIFDLINPVSAK